MKTQKRFFNEALIRYNKYRRKLRRMEITGSNEHRQDVLRKHIERLYELLSTMMLTLKKAVAVGALTAAVFVATSDETNAQTFEPVVNNPFGLTTSGGWSSRSFADLDSDGDLDAMAGNGSGGFIYFENTGTSSSPAFGSAVTDPFGLTDIGDNSSASFADLDNDGDLDLMSGEYYGDFFYFENTGSSSAPAFAAAQTNPFGLADIGGLSVASFADLDDDGDFDLMAGEGYGEFFYFENIGTVSNPIFTSVVSNPFGLTDIGNTSIPSFPDLDNDGDLDLLVGESGGNFKYFENTGTIGSPAFAVVGTNPFALTDIGSSSSPSFADLDNDGDLDLFAGKALYGDFLFFENLTITKPYFLAPLTNPFSLTDLGYYSFASFGDLDNDGDLDMIGGESYGNFQYFENTGNAAAPAFETLSSNPFSIAKFGFVSAPFLVDLDDDDDLDLMSGDSDGNFYYFENTGTVLLPSFDAVETNPFSLTDIGDKSKPYFADLDSDGDMDLMTGNNFGDFNYFENIGTASVPVFASPVTAPFSLPIAHGSRTTPSLVDMDGDGDLDLLSADNNDFLYYKNIGTSTAPIFDAEVINPFFLSKASTYSLTPTFADLDNDGDMDVIIGEQNGSFFYFERTPPVVFVWDGETSADWATATNWEGDVAPSSIRHYVEIPDVATDPVITTDVEANSVEIEESAALIISTNSLLVNTELIIDGSLSVSSGASLIPLESIIGSGSATINRNTTFGVNDGQYSVIGSPVTAGSTSSLGGIVYSYDETIGYDAGGTNGSTRFERVNTPETMAVGDAYFSANTGNISFVGIPNSGDIDVSLVYDEISDGASNAGFNLVSNPYTSAISYDQMVDDEDLNGEWDGTVYLWDDGGSDISGRSNADYITANSMGSASGGSSRSGAWDGYIRSAQGFFVKALEDNGPSKLRFRPFMMDISNNSDDGYFRKGEEKSETIRLSLSSSSQYNDILIGFAEEATSGLDRAMDAYKIKGSSLQLYSRAGKSILAIQALPISEEQMTVDLGFDAGDAGIYSVNIEDISSYGSEILLIDHLLNKSVSLTETGAYTFQTKAVHNSDRFSLLFAPHEILSLDDQLKVNDMIVFTNDNTLNVRVNQGLTNATVNIYNMSGTLMKQVNQVDFSEGNWTTSFTGQGLFIMSVKADGQLFIKKFISK